MGIKLFISYFFGSAVLRLKKMKLGIGKPVGQNKAYIYTNNHNYNMKNTIRLAALYVKKFDICYFIKIDQPKSLNQTSYGRYFPALQLINHSALPRASNLVFVL
jgi:hypothetical protein